MKTKNLLQTSILVIALCVMNQFTNAQSIAPASTGKSITPITNPQPLIINCHCTLGGGFSGCGLNDACKMYCRAYCRYHHSRIAGNGSSVADETFFIDIYPNPISSSATISFFLEQSQKISMRVYDVNGRLIKTITDSELAEGEHQVEWNSDELSAGIYFLQFQSTEYFKIEKLIVTK